MELCSDGHDEICFDGRNCPACELLKTISDREDGIFKLNEKIDELKDEIGGLKG